LTFNTLLNTKFSAAHTNRTGIDVTGLFYDLDYWISPDLMNIPPGDMYNFAKDKDGTLALSAFSQSSLRFNSQLTANIGLQVLYFHLTEKAAVEPRVSFRWQVNPRHALSLAYGKHSKRENTDYYFVKTENNIMVNNKLDLAKAHHLVASYDWSISEKLHLKIEPYFQYLYDVPVMKDSLLSLINYRDWWMTLPLVNDGKGKNYGVDFTLERYLQNGYYYLVTASLFESLYTGGDGVWRNTRLNRNYIINALGGKEWKMGKQKQNILSLSLRFTLQGGECYIPVDEAASIAAKELIYDNTRAYDTQMKPEFITHLNISYTINRQKLSHEFALKMYNLNMNEEFGGYYYNHRTDRPEMYKGAVSIPNLSYKINF
jgi:ribosomal protein L32